MHADYPDVAMEFMYVDNAAMQLVTVRALCVSVGAAHRFFATDFLLFTTDIVLHNRRKMAT